MEETVKYFNHEQYLEIIFTGERCYEAFNDSIEKVFNECQKMDIQRILLDGSGAKGDWKEFDRFQVGKLVSQFFGEQYKILGVDKEAKINRFAENTAFNRGVNILVTHDKKAGLNWLLKMNRD
ncbi:MAG: hypothetical protein JRL30_12705 [Deltaproteobacteria bacterium]|nr:hypothetical protein [Deltaproteobacteria bacterium]